MFHDVNFNAEVRDLFDVNGNRVPRELGQGVYRDDTGELISISGKSTNLIQHMDVLNPVVEFLDANGYDVQERSSASRGSLYDLAGKKGAFVSPKVTDNGAVMRTDIILGDFIQPTGSTAYLDDGPDTNLFKISVLNSHNNKYAAQADFSYLRLLCMNGQTLAAFTAGVYGKHTKGFNFDGMKRQIENAMGAMHDDADRFGLWAKTKVTVEQAEQMLKATIAKLPNKPNGDAHWSQPLLDKVLTRFRQEDQTVWGLYNAATYWSTHTDFRANSDRITATIGREGKIASMLKSDHWNEMIAI